MKLAVAAGLIAAVLALVFFLAAGGRTHGGLVAPSADERGPGSRAEELFEPETPGAPAPQEPERAAVEADTVAGLARLSGVVMDRGQKRFIAGALLRLSSFERKEGQPRFGYETTTGSDGTFDFEVAVGAEASARAGQKYLMHVSHPDFEIKTMATPPMRPGLGITRHLYLTPRRSEGLVEVEVLVRDDTGPILGAIPMLFNEMTRRPGSETYFQRVDSDPTDGEGRAILECSSLGRKLIVVSTQGLGLQLYRAELVVEAPGRTSHTAWLERGLAIAGVVRATGGELIPIQMKLDPDAELEVEQVLVASQAGGIFRVEGVAPGIHTLEFTGSEDEWWSPFRIQVEAGQEDLELVIKRAYDPTASGLHLGEIHGTVNTGDELFGGGVWIEKVDTLARDELERDVWPNAAQRNEKVLFRKAIVVGAPETGVNAMRVLRDGLVLEVFELGFDFHFMGLEDGDYCVFARHPGRAPAIAGPFSIRGASLVTGVQLDPPLKAATVSGRVLDTEGGPIPMARVLATGTGKVSNSHVNFGYGEQIAIELNDNAKANEYAVFTDAEGFFTLESVPVGLPIRVVALRSGWQPAASPDLNLAPGETVTGIQLLIDQRGP